MNIGCCCFAAVSRMKRMVNENLFLKNESLFNESCDVFIDCVNDTSQCKDTWISYYTIKYSIIYV